MTLLSTLNDDMKTAMKAKDKETLQVIRMLKASIQNEQIKKGADLNEEEELTVLSREMKQRRDSLTEFEKADRTDLAEKVKGEIAIVEKYLPAQLDEAEIPNRCWCDRKNRSFFSEGIRKSDGRCDASSKRQSRRQPSQCDRQRIIRANVRTRRKHLIGCLRLFCSFLVSIFK